MSVYLGQFTDENAERIIEAFDAAGVGWSAKSSGAFARVVFAGDWGVRLFATEDGQAGRAWEIAAEIAPDGVVPRRPSR